MRRTSGSILLASSTEKLARMRELCAEAVPWSSPPSESLFCCPLFKPATASLLCRFETTLLILALRDQLRNFERFSISVDRYESQVARIGVPAIPSLQILRLNAYADFHRSTTDIIHAALHDHEIAEVNRLTEIDTIYGRSHTDRTRVPYRTDRRRRVHHREDNSSKNQPQIVRVLGQ